jgi:hypothetical protein
MANKKISQLNALGTAPAGTDILPITDVSDTTGSPQGTTKRVTVANLHSGLQAEPSEGAFVDGDKTKLDSALQSLSAGALSDFDFDDNPIFGFAAKVETPTITANAYTLVAADNGKVLALDNGATAMTLNVDTGLPASFNCSFVQKGAGQVSFAGTATVNNRQSHTKINGQYGVASIVAYDTDTYILAGDTTS